MTRDEVNDLQREYTAATLVGLRIIRGVTELEIAHRMGYLGKLPKGARARRRAEEAAIAQVRCVEREMADARLSTYQRYSRAVSLDMRMAPGLYFPTRLPRLRPLTVARIIREQRARDARNARRR